jgi:hypothetical protein
MEPIGIYGHLVNFTAIWYICWSFWYVSPFWYVIPTKKKSGNPACHSLKVIRIDAHLYWEVGKFRQNLVHIVCIGTIYTKFVKIWRKRSNFAFGLTRPGQKLRHWWVSMYAISMPRSRVTRWVWEKVAQNVAQPILVKINTHLLLFKKSIKIFALHP